MGGPFARRDCRPDRLTQEQHSPHPVQARPAAGRPATVQGPGHELRTPAAPFARISEHMAGSPSPKEFVRPGYSEAASWGMGQTPASGPLQVLEERLVEE